MTRSRVYRDGQLVSENFAPDQLAANLADPDTVVWLDLQAPTKEDLTDLIQDLGLHPLAVDDAVQRHQRPKLSRYPGHALAIAYAVEITESGRLVAHELAVFIAKQTLVTVRKDPHFDIEKVVERWDQETDIDQFGVGYLLYGVLDYIVDSYLDAVATLDDQIESLEDDIFTLPPNAMSTQRRSLALHKSLAQLRRKVSPMREMITPLLHRDHPLGDEHMQPYYQDVLDHVLWATEQVESLRDEIATVRDTQLNLQGNRMNLIMKKVTSWAAIIAVPTAITGFYGQNLPVPGADHALGLWISTSAIVVVSIILYASFKRKDWL